MSVMYQQYIVQIIFVLILKSIHCWNSQCSPCQCTELDSAIKISDCNSAVTSFQLFNIPQLHDETEAVFLSGQQLHIIPEEAFFKGRNKLKAIDLKNCQVRNIHVKAFKNLENLNGLELSYNELTQLDENIFAFNYKLKTLIIQHNNIQTFPEKIFYNLFNLEYLDVSNNKLQYIYPNQFVNNIKLNILILQSNHLTKFDTNISNLKSLQVLYLDNNSWKCDCETKHLLKYFTDHNIEYIDDDNYPTCNEPKQWKNKAWLDIPDLCTVSPKPVVKVTEGNPVQITCALDNTLYIPIHWLLNGQSLDVNDNNLYVTNSFYNGSNYIYTLTINKVTINDSGVYKCWTDDGESQSDETTLNVEKGTKPKFPNPQDEQKLVRNGAENYKLSCDVVGDPLPEIQWFINGQLLTTLRVGCPVTIDFNTNKLVFKTFEDNCVGKYTCRATSSVGVAEKSYKLEKTNAKPEIDSQTDINISEEGSVNLQCLVAISEGLVVTWIRNGKTLTTNNKYSISQQQINSTHYNFVLTINDISLNEAGNYKCKANGNESPPYSVQVNSPVEIEHGDENEEELILEPGQDKNVKCRIKGVKNAVITWEYPDCNKNTNVKDFNLELKDVKCSGRYKCIVKTSKRTYTKEFNLLVKEPQIFIIPPVTNSNIYENDIIVLQCLVENAIKSQPFWTYNNIHITHFSNMKINKIQLDKNKFYYNLIIHDISLANSGNYKCNIQNKYVSQEINVQKYNSVKFVQVPKKITYATKGTKNYKLQCKVSGSETDVTWKYTSSNCNYEQYIEDHNNENTAVLIIKELVDSCTNDYSCEASNKMGTEKYDFKLNIVDLKQPKIEKSSNEVNKAIENEEIVLKCLIRAGDDIKPKWIINGEEQHNHTIIREDISPMSYYFNLVIKKVQPKDGGNYKCIIGDFGDTTVLEIVPKSKPNIEYISNLPPMEVGMKNIKIVSKISGIPTPNGTWDVPPGCKHNITKEKSDNSQWIYLNIPEVTSDCGGQYIFIAANDKGEQKSTIDIEVLNMNKPTNIEIKTENNDDIPIEDENVILKCFVKSKIYKPQWLRNGHIISNNIKYQIKKEHYDQTSYWYNLQISKLSQNDKGPYKCQIHNMESEITLDIKPKTKPVIEYIPIIPPIEAGTKNVRIATKISGTPLPNATWHLPTGCNHYTTRETNENSQWVYLTIPEVTNECAGLYTFVATNSKGVETSTLNVEVVSMDEPPFTEIEDNIAIENEKVVLKCFIKIKTHVAHWIRNGKIITDNNKHKIEIIKVNQTSYWYNLHISKLSEQDKGSYKCKVNNLESNVFIKDIQKSTRPKIEYISNPIAVEEGKNDFTLSCKVTGIPKPKVTWHVQGRPISKIISNYLDCRYVFSSEIDNFTEWTYLTIRNVVPSCSGHYTCDTLNLVGGEQSTIHLNVISKSPPQIEPIPDETYEGGNVTLKCLIKGNLDSKPHWLHNNVPIKTNNKHKTMIIPIDKTSYYYNLEIKEVSSKEEGQYKCKINDLETPVLLKILPSSIPDLLEDFNDEDLNISEGTKERILPCRAKSTPVPKITWYYESLPLYQNSNCHRQQKIGENQINLILQNVGPTCAGRYKCVAENIKGKAEKEINVIVNSVPRPTIKPKSDNKILVAGENFTIKCLVPDRRKHTAKWYKENELIILEPNGRYSFTIEDINTTAYWHNLEISNLQLNDEATKYKCIINDISSQSYSIPIIEQPTKPKIEYIPAKVLIIPEGTKKFQIPCKVSGLPKPKIHLHFQPKLNAPTDICKVTQKISDDSDTAYFIIEEVTPYCTGTYICNTRNSVGFEQQEINLLVNPTKPTLELLVKLNTLDGVLRQNNDVTLQCLTTGNSKVNWYFNKNLVKPDKKYVLSKQEINPMSTWHILTIKNVSSHDKGIYTCKTNNIQQSYNLEIASELPITVDYLVPPNIIVDENSELVLSCKVRNTDENNVDWTFNNEPLAESSCNIESTQSIESTELDLYVNLTIFNIDSSCTGQFKCNVEGLEHYDVIDVTVIENTPPEIILEENEFMEGEKIILKCLITSGNIDSAKWFYKNQEIQTNDKYIINRLILNETNFWYNLELKSATPQQQGQYKCISGNSETSTNIYIGSAFKPIIETISNPETIVSEGDEVTLFCKTNAWPPAIVILQPTKHSTSCNFKHSFDVVSQLYSIKTNAVHPSCSGQYVCEASNSKGQDTKYINLTVVPAQKPKITINSTSSDGIIREGDTVVFSCLVTTKNKDISWYFSKIDDLNTNTQIKSYDIDPFTRVIELTITNIKLQQSGKYICGNNELNNAINIDIIPGRIPVIDSIPDSIVTVFGLKSPAIFCKVSGFPKPNVNWFFYDRPINLQNPCRYKINSDNQWYNLTIENPIPSCIGNYRCVANNVKGKTEKGVVVRSVQQQRPETNIITVDNNNIVVENDKITLTCLVTGDISLPVQWLHDGKPVQFNKINKEIKEQNSETSFWYNLQIERVSLQHSGNYQCKTSFSQSDINLNVRATSKPTISINAPPKLFIPQGKEQMITCTTTSVPIPSVAWQRNDNTVDICTNNCQLKKQEITNNENAQRRLHLTINGAESCSGRYKCIAENINGKTEKYIDVVVIPYNQPNVHIREPVYPTLNTDVTISCEITSVDNPTIYWKNQDKTVNYDRSKYIINNKHVGNNLIISNLTIRNFQQSDMAEYKCEAKLHNTHRYKTISLKSKQKFKPYFEKLPNLWNNIDINNNDLVFINKVKSYPPPKLDWNLQDRSKNSRYKTAVEYINNDSYWFNITINDFNQDYDTGVYTFSANNGVDIDEKKIAVSVDEGQLVFEISQDNLYVEPSATAT